jgi:hypothetical protein
MMRRYTKKPVVIEAMQWTGINRPEILKFCNSCYVLITNDPNKPELKIQTLEGTMSSRIGDYIIKGVEGEFYPCREDIFLKTYQEVTDEQIK